MKTLLHLFVFLLLTLLATSCLEEKCDSRVAYIAYEPVLVNAADFRTDITVAEARDLCNPTAFYVYGDYLMTIESKQGLHILDNSDATNPTPISFLPIAGAAGLAVRNDILYVNNYVDLISFDLSNPRTPRMVGRTEDVFEPYSVFTSDLGYEEMVVDYVETDAIRYIDCNDIRSQRRVFLEDGIFFGAAGESFANFSSANGEASGSGGGNEQVGIGGSLARFTITNGTLYAVDENQLKTFNLNNPIQPEFMGNVTLNWNVETIFPYGDELYIGTNSGMHIFDASEPLNPSRLSSIEHVRSCDPVIVHNDKAYLTLRGGSFCGGFENQLEIFDVRNPSFPTRLQIYPMDGPAGLTIADNKLFICQPGHNLKIYALDNNGMRGRELNSSTEYQEAMDVIGLPWLDRVILRGGDGIRQMTYSDGGELQELSHLQVCPEL